MLLNQHALQPLPNLKRIVCFCVTLYHTSHTCNETEEAENCILKE